MDELVQKIIAGETSAVEKFYRTFAPKLQRYLSQRLPENADKEAYLHDILLEVIDSLPLFAGKSSLVSWVYKIAHNKLVDFYRKKKVKSILLSKIPFLDSIAQDVYDPVFQYEKNKLRDTMQETLRSMSQKYRDILEMHYLEDLSIKEIAIILDMSPKAAESLLFRARANFRKTYAKR